jgi:hypothetical protein
LNGARPRADHCVDVIANPISDVNKYTVMGIIFWDIKLYSPLEGHPHFGGTSVDFYRLHGVMFQKTALSKITVVRTSNPSSAHYFHRMTEGWQCFVH